MAREMEIGKGRLRKRHSIKVAHTVKKVSRFPVPSRRDVINQSLSRRGIIKKLFPTRESSVGDIPLGDGKTANLFFTV
jgi:hypothetical protein